MKPKMVYLALRSLVVGVSLGLPLFLYLREPSRAAAPAASLPDER